MKRIFIITILAHLFASCEEVVVIDLPRTQNLVVIEGFISNLDMQQEVIITQSTGFISDIASTPITNADVRIRSTDGDLIQLNHTQNGRYLTENTYQGQVNISYQLLIELDDESRIISDWDKMEAPANPDTLFVESFEENDPENGGEVITVFYPKILVRDSNNYENFYRWRFFRNFEENKIPEPFTIQSDLFFDGNLIPNEFDEFEYQENDTAVIELVSISEATFSYLELLSSQITTLGTSSGTTPAQVMGNLRSTSNRPILGYFGTESIRSDTLIMNIP